MTSLPHRSLYFEFSSIRPSARPPSRLERLVAVDSSTITITITTTTSSSSMVKSSRRAGVTSPAAPVSVSVPKRAAGVRKARSHRPCPPCHSETRTFFGGRRRLRKPVSGPAKAGGQGSAGEGQKESGSRSMRMGEATEIELEDFMKTGRTGRRNAMSEISDPSLAGLSTASLPLDLAKLSCSESMDADSSSQLAKGTKQAKDPPS
ncbi:hypothetical protein ACOMHN_052512 [Nucella lapillus]